MLGLLQKTHKRMHVTMGQTLQQYLLPCDKKMNGGLLKALGAMPLFVAMDSAHSALRLLWKTH